MPVKTWDFIPLDLEGAFLISPFVQEDERGSFIKDYSSTMFEHNGITHPLLEVFYSTSKKDVIRGLHFQRICPQAKLIRCIKGCIVDVIVDIRPSSTSFGKWESFELSQDNNLELFIPGYFAHGFMALENCIVAYKCNVEFLPEGDDGIRYDDKDLAIKWPIAGKYIISDKDNKLQTFSNYKHKINIGGVLIIYINNHVYVSVSLMVLYGIL